MAITLNHQTEAVGTDAGNGEIRKAEWNEDHQLTGAAQMLLGFDENGDAEETRRVRGLQEELLAVALAAYENGSPTGEFYPAPGSFDEYRATVDLALGNLFTLLLEADASLQVTNLPPAGLIQAFALRITDGGAHELSWWDEIHWPMGIAPTLSVEGTDLVGFIAYGDATTPWFDGFVIAYDQRTAL
jgi:hypothetical protein